MEGWLEKLQEIVQEILGTTTKLQTARNIKLTGAVSGNANFDGSKDLTITTTLANIAIVTGTLTLAEGKASGSYNYPTGFNGSNCVVLSFMAHKTDVSNVAGYGYLETAAGYSKGAIGHSVSLTSSGIDVNINNPTDDAHTSGTGTYDIKIIILKIS